MPCRGRGVPIIGDAIELILQDGTKICGCLYSICTKSNEIKLQKQNGQIITFKKDEFTGVRIIPKEAPSTAADKKDEVFH